jgi:hypothetical protein
MAARDYQIAFNRGVVDKKATVRGDVKRIAMSAEQQMNWVPQALGAMTLRPGWEYLGALATTSGAVKLIPFIFSVTDTALVEVTDEKLRFWVDEALVTRTAVSTAFTNGTFDTDLSSWTDNDEGVDAISDWYTGGYMRLTGGGANGAKRSQTLTIGVSDQNVEHAIRVVVSAGSCLIRVGSTTDLDDYITETELGQGTHSLAFTPTGGSAYVHLINRKTVYCLVDSVAIEGAGVMSITTGLLPEETLDEVRYVQSGDILFIARGTTRPPVKIERRSTKSWSVVFYYSEDGPFMPANVTGTTITPSAIVSSAAAPTITLTASKGIFKSTNIGSLYRLTSTGQTVFADNAAAAATSTDSIRVFGITTGRTFTITLTGTGFTGTVDLEQSVGEEGSWTVIDSWTADTSETYNDGLDNQVVYYRLTLSAYTAGSIDMTLTYSTGSITGIAKVVAYTSPTVVTAVVLKDLGSVDATDDWAESSWSDRRGYPSAVAIYQSRLYWAGKDKVWGSAVDNYYSFTDIEEGDATPISRSIGSGPVDSINWLVPTRQLIVGAQGAEIIARSNSLDEPLTPSNFNLKEYSTNGSAPVDPMKVDTLAFFVDRSTQRVFQIDASADMGAETNELTVLAPEICYPNIIRTAVQRRPETRLYMLLCTGTVVVCTFDRAEEVKAFWTIETLGLVEDIAVIPGDCGEDLVYFAVAREVNGSIVRYLERSAKMTEARGGTICKIMDSFKEYSGTSTVTITGLSHLEGESVVVWGNNKDLGTYTVASASITLSEYVNKAYVGLPYHAMFVSNKLGFSTIGIPALGPNTRVSDLSLVLVDTDADGLEYGTDEDHLDGLPTVDEGTDTTAGYLWDYYDYPPVPVNGSVSNNTRLYLKATAPRPCTVLAANAKVEGF